MNFHISRYAAISAFCTREVEGNKIWTILFPSTFSRAYLKGRKIRIFLSRSTFPFFLLANRQEPPHSSFIIPLILLVLLRLPIIFVETRFSLGKPGRPQQKPEPECLLPPIIPLRRQGKEMGKHMCRREDKSLFLRAGRIGLCEPGPSKKERRKTTVSNI